MLLPAAVLGALLVGCMAYCASGVAMLRLRHGRRHRRAAAAGQEQEPAATDGWCIGSVADTADAAKQADAKQAVIPIQAVALANMPAAIPAPDVPSTQLPPVAPPIQQPAIRIFSSLDLTLVDVSRLEAQLVASRNRFVCLQLATMAREQLAAVQQARAAGESRQLAAAARMHFATLEVDGSLAAGALFYPRDGSHKSGCDGCSSSSAAPAEAAACTACASLRSSERSSSACSGGGGGCAAHDPHVYVELLVTNQPGRGWGSLLLGAIERHAAAHAATALAAASGCPPRSLKLLSVGSAQQFYRRCGYGEPDERKEMAKPLAAVALPAGVPAA